MKPVGPATAGIGPLQPELVEALQMKVPGGYLAAPELLLVHWMAGWLSCGYCIDFSMTVWIMQVLGLLKARVPHLVPYLSCWVMSLVGADLADLKESVCRNLVSLSWFLGRG